MRKGAWIRHISRRWLAARKVSGGAAPSILAAAGIAVGVAALITVLGVMNGFQLGYIDTILEVSSYDVRLDWAGDPSGRPALLARLRSMAGVRSVVDFAETQVLATSNEGRSLPLKLRAVPPDTEESDASFAPALGLEQGALASARGLVIGSELARYLNVAVGDEIVVLTVSSTANEGLSTQSQAVPVGAIFHSGFYDFDIGLAFISQAATFGLFPSLQSMPLSYGIKLTDRDHDARLVSVLEAQGIRGAQGWRDYNKAFFGALKTEKSIMMILVGLIFVVVGVNIHQSMRRSVFERMEEIALLKAFGGTAEEIRRIFVIDGIAIGVSGAFIGLALGLLLATNINEAFSFVERAGNWIGTVAQSLMGGGKGDFSIYSPRYFYLMEVPVRLLYPETTFIVAAAVASAAGAAASAATQVAELEPAELLRYE